MKDEITTPHWFDARCHFRQLVNPDDTKGLISVVKETARYCAYGVAMPNTRPPIVNGEDIYRYRREILEETGDMPWFQPVMICNVCDTATPETIRSAHKAGALAGKVYPRGGTTNAANGLANIREGGHLFEAMQELGMRLLVHGESTAPETLVTKRESAFLDDFRWLVEEFPDLQIVLEHVSTAEAAWLVEDMPDNVRATITGHHLWTTLDDVCGDGTHPHNMCLPIPKDYSDRDTLIKLATGGYPKFMLGSDTAPHLRQHKESAHGACGAFTAPLLPSLIIEVFEQEGALDTLNDFVLSRAAEFYGLRVEGTVTFSRSPWTVPEELYGVVPFMAGSTRQWRVKD